MRNQCAPSPTSSGASHRAASPIVDQQRPRGRATRPASGATTSATAGLHASSDLREAALHLRPPRAIGAHDPKNTGSDTTVGDPDPPPGEAAKEQRIKAGRRSIRTTDNTNIVIHRAFKTNTLLALVPGSNRNYKNPALLGIQLAVGPQPLWLRDHNSGPAQRIMVKRLATSPHDPLGITHSACKNQSVVVSVQYGPFNPYIPIRSTIIGKLRVAKDPIAMHTSWRSNSDIASVTSIGYPRMSASGESSTTIHRLLHASGSHPIPTPYDPKFQLPGSPVVHLRNL
ncbi:hypothetical protein F511_26114 [Dorcoceras hygrometricum]|uniref:Uncharacterized protein n=1 Tax=Dorcoceras hygrometricum TaxID=472368 RepID=A0A2Z7DB90_9LAMI|nr:hypothetical protein F511_26114 [Dorcoceras hygrometricum]